MFLRRCLVASGLLVCVLTGPASGGVHLPTSTRPPAAEKPVITGERAPRVPARTVERAPLPGPIGPGEGGPPPRRTQQRYRAEAVLPEDAYVFISVRSPAQLWEEVKKLRLSGMLEEPLLGKRLKAFFSSFENAFEPGKADPRSITGMLGKAGIAPRGMLKALSSQTVLAVRKGRKGVNSYLIIDLTGCEENLKEMVDDFVSQVRSKHQEVFIDPKIYKDYARVNFTLTDGSAYGYAYLGNLLVIGAGEEAVEEIIDQVVTGAARPLAENDTFQQLADELEETASVFYYVHLSRLGREVGGAGKLGAPAAPGLDRAASLTQIAGNVGVVAGAAFTLEGGIRDRIVLTADNPAKPILPGLTLRGLRQKVTSFAPLDSILYASAYIDAAEAYKWMMKQVELVQPNAAIMLKAAVKNLERKVGEGFLSLIKGEAGLIVARSSRRHTPDVVLVLETVDGRRAQQVIEGLEEQLGPSLVRSNVGRLTIWSYVPPGESLPFEWKPAVSVVDDFVVIGTSDDTVGKVVRQRRFATSNLTQNTNYKTATRDLPQNAAVLFFVDLPQLVNVVYDVLLVLMSQMKEEDLAQVERYLGVRMDSLPTPEALASHLVPVAETVRMSENKLFVDVYGPCGSLVLPLAAMARYSTQMGTLVQEQNQEVLEQRMQTIGLGLHLYAADWDRFPVNLSELYPNTYVTEREAFMAPTGKRQVFAKDDIDKDSDFVYVRGVRLTDLSESILLYTKSYVHKEMGRTALLLAPVPQRLADGRLVYKSVKYMPEAEFQAKMADQGHKVED